MTAPQAEAGSASPALVLHDRGLDDLTARELLAVLTLRSAVFVVEQACAYADPDGRDADPSTGHVWLAPDGRPTEVAAYLRVLVEPAGGWRVGRVATAPAWRGSGLAARLVTHVLDTRPGPVVLDAQAHLQGWYERLGFAVTGSAFVEDGIPHVPMRLGR